MPGFWDSPIGIGSVGIGEDLASNPFGGMGLNVGGFTGADATYGAAAGGGLFQGFGPLSMGLAGANSVMTGMQQSAANKSLANAMAAQNAMYDADFGKGFLAQNLDRFRSFNDPVRAGQIMSNAGPYRQGQLTANLPGLAGRWGGPASAFAMG